ncbi:MAG: hypothetical protein ACTILQ_01705, partial [Streptococcus thermophilus]
NRYQNHLSYQLYGVKPVNSRLHNISVNSTVRHEKVIFTRKKGNPRIPPSCSKPYYITVPHE